MEKTLKCTYPFEPFGDFIFLVLPKVKVDDNHCQEGGHGDEEHIQAEIGACNESNQAEGTSKSKAVCSSPQQKGCL